MPTYFEITTAQIDAFSIVNVSLASGWTNNLLAVIENDPTAPDIINLTEDSMSELTSGDAIRHAIIPIEAMNDQLPGNVMKPMPEFALVVQRSGDYQIRFEMRSGTATGFARAQLHVNSPPNYSGYVPIAGAVNEGDGQWSVKLTNGALSAGDTLTVFADRNTSPSVHVRNLELRSNNKPFGG